MTTDDWGVLLGSLIAVGLVVGSLLATVPLELANLTIPASALIFPVTYVALTVTIEGFSERTANMAVLAGIACLLLTACLIQALVWLPPPMLLRAVTPHTEPWVIFRALLSTGVGFAIGYWVAYIGGYWLFRDHSMSLIKRLLVAPTVAQLISGTLIVVGTFAARADIPNDLFWTLLINRNVFALLFSAITAPIAFWIIHAIRRQRLEHRLGLDH